MRLFLCRHAIAADAEQTTKDVDRPLTKEGTQKFKKAAAGFAPLAANISHVLTSPALRARQTAEIMEEALLHAKVNVEVVITPALGGNGKLEALLKEIRGLKRVRDVVAVGHEPTLSAWIALMCGGAKVEMKKGAIAVVELADKGPRGKLVALLPPKVLRAMRK